MAITGDSSPRVGQAQDYAEAGWTSSNWRGSVGSAACHQPHPMRVTVVTDQEGE